MRTNQHTPADIAEHVAQAAEMIAKYGVERGTYWGGPLACRYERGSAIDVIGALAVTYGLDLKTSIDEHFAGVPYFHDRTGEYVSDDVHPALAALMSDLDVTEVEQVFEWSDSRPEVEVVGYLRDFAAKLRDRDVVPAGGA